MYKIFIPNNNISDLRGGGRYIQALKENLGEDFQFISDLKSINQDDVLFICNFDYFKPPIITKRHCKKQILIIFDAIPLKYPQNFPIGIRGKINLWRNKSTLKNFDKILTISQHAKSDISNNLGVPSEKIAVIYPKIAQFLYEENCTSTKVDGEKYCIYVGDVNWNKNLVNMIEAIKIADVKLMLIGKPFSNDCGLDALSHPWQKEYKEVLSIVKKDDHFQLMGYQSDDNLKNLYRNAYLNLLVSRDEGFGYSYMEAASQACPSLLNDIDVFHETSNEAAFFVDSANPEKIAKAITDIFSNNQQRDTIAKLAKERFEIFSKIDISREFQKLAQE